MHQIFMIFLCAVVLCCTSIKTALIMCVFHNIHQYTDQCWIRHKPTPYWWIISKYTSTASIFLNIYYYCIGQLRLSLFQTPLILLNGHKINKFTVKTPPWTDMHYCTRFTSTIWCSITVLLASWALISILVNITELLRIQKLFDYSSIAQYGLALKIQFIWRLGEHRK